MSLANGDMEVAQKECPARFADRNYESMHDESMRSLESLEKCRYSTCTLPARLSNFAVYSYCVCVYKGVESFARAVLL